MTGFFAREMTVFLATAVALPLLMSKDGGGASSPVMMVAAASSTHTSRLVLPAPTRLRVEGLVPHMAVLSVGRPRFSFVHARGTAAANSSRGLSQAAYRVSVLAVQLGGGSERLWDSGKVLSSACSQITSGVDLPAFGAYSFEVQWWRSDGAESATATADFETGPLATSDWGDAAFLGGDLLRTELVLPHDAAVVRARAYVVAPGCHALEINGRKAKENLRGICPFMAPGRGQGGIPRFSPRALYQTHNITSLLRPGTNVVGLLSGHVFTSTPSLVCLLRVELGNGIVVWSRSATDAAAGWIQGPSYLTHNEYTSHIDWTKREAGWSSAGFKPTHPSQWSPGSSPDASASTPSLAKQMTIDAVMMPPATVVTQLRPISVQNLTASNGNNNSQCPQSSGLLGGTRKECQQCTKTDSLVLTCATGVISKIDFASWGTPTGQCGSFSASTCNSNASYSIVAKACLGKSSCTLVPSRNVWGADPCFGKIKVLAVQASGCTPAATPPIPSTETKVYLYTFERNFVGTIRLAPLPNAVDNSTVTMVLGEWLENNVPKIRGGPQVESHTLVSGNPASLETLFVWHGFQFVVVTSTGDTGFDGNLAAITGLEIRTDVESVSSIRFAGDDEQSDVAAAMFNDINTISRASMVSNVAAYMPTDCPTAEKRGYLGDASFAAPGTLWNFDFQPVYTSFANVIADSQTPSGDVPTSVPCPFPGPGTTLEGCGAIINWTFPAKWGPSHCNDIAWTSGFPIILEQAYLFSGDTRPLEAHWMQLHGFTENLISKASAYKGDVASCDPGENFVSHNVVALGDWVAPAKCSGKPVGSRCEVNREVGGMSYILALRSMAVIAAAIGQNATAARYQTLADTAATSFHALHWNNATASYGGDTGMSQVLTVPALVVRASPTAAIVAKAAAELQHDLEARTDYHLATGAVLSKWLLEVLSEHGMHQEAIKVATQTTFPSWGWWLALNATTCWETWHNGTGHHDGIGPFTNAANSHNHVMLCGGVSAWFWTQLAGLKPTSAGFVTFTVAPRVDATLGPASVNASYSAPTGDIHIKWSRNATAQTVELTVDVPIGVQSAIISVPTPFNGTRGVTESGMTVWREQGIAASLSIVKSVQWLSTERDAVSFRVGSGRFIFQTITEHSRG